MSISVVITCYNNGAFISDAIDSVLQQTKAHLIDKIVVVDDGSTDDSWDVLDSLRPRDHRIELLRENRRGPSYCRNRGIECTESEWIAILDGDDIWLPTKIEQQWNKIQEVPDLGLIYTGYSIFKNLEQGATRAKVRNLERSSDTQSDYFRYDGPVIPSTVMVRRREFNHVGGFDADVRIFEDTEFFARIAGVAKFGFIAESLVLKRVHSGAITASWASLMAHHAYVAFRICERSPRLLPLIPRRLADRARKLGNTAISANDVNGAKDFYRIALSLSPLDVPARLSLIALQTGIPLKGIRSLLLSRRADRSRVSDV
ncbi:glycosyltransferase family 2 protein [Microvirga sp. 2YAF29]|uniref:glycosyltransferase family 2 protein n=1 Tax=Microvirga sp. 2YAF29 TaxID=3233031 RepID=UPI003F9BF5F4